MACLEAETMLLPLKVQQKAWNLGACGTCRIDSECKSEILNKANRFREQSIFFYFALILIFEYMIATVDRSYESLTGKIIILGRDRL